MKSLRESLFDSKTQMTESLFDKDLVEKNIGFFDYYDWKFGAVSLIKDGYAGKLDFVFDDDNSFNKCFKFKEFDNKLPHYKGAIDRSNDSKYDQFIFRQIYDTLSNTPITEIDDKSKLMHIISDSIKNIIKSKTSGGGSLCTISPYGSGKPNIFNDKIKSITITDDTYVYINNKIYELEIYLSFKRK